MMFLKGYSHKIIAILIWRQCLDMRSKLSHCLLVSHEVLTLLVLVVLLLLTYWQTFYIVYIERISFIDILNKSTSNGLHYTVSFTEEDNYLIRKLEQLTIFSVFVLIRQIYLWWELQTPGHIIKSYRKTNIKNSYIDILKKCRI